MSFRYKSALLSLVSLAVIYGWYFATIVAGRGTASHADPAMLLFVTVLLLIIVQVVGHIVLAIISREGQAPMDERERGFDRRATGVGYYALIAGALMATATLHLGAHAHGMANGVLLAIVIAECLRQATFLVLHHRAA